MPTDNKVLAAAREVVSLSQRDADLRMSAMIQAYIDMHDSGDYRVASKNRWIRSAGAWESEIGMSILSESPDKFDAAVDAAMKGKQ